MEPTSSSTPQAPTEAVAPTAGAVIQPSGAVTPPPSPVTPPSVSQADAAPVAPAAPAVAAPLPAPTAPAAAPATPSAKVVQPQPQPPAKNAGINIGALQTYEDSEIATSTLGIIKGDPELKKKATISLILILTVVLSPIGIVMAILLLLKVSIKQKAMKLEANQAIFNRFASDNGWQVQNMPAPLGLRDQLGLLDQLTVQFQNAAAMTGNLASLTPAPVESAVVGTLPAGCKFSVQLAHVPIHIEDVNGINTTAYRATVAGGFSVGTGSAFDSKVLEYSSMKNLKNDSFLFTVTYTPGSDGSPIDGEVSVDGEYLFVEVSVCLGDSVVVPHVLLYPEQAGSYRLPLYGKDRHQLKLEGDFNNYFSVITPEGYETEVLEILEPDTMVSIMNDMPGITIEFVGNQMNLMLPIKPYSGESRLLLADTVTRLYGLAAKYEPWIKQRFANWRFSPQSRPYHMTLIDDTAQFYVVQAINSVSPTHIRWVKTQTYDAPAATPDNSAGEPTV